MNEEVSEINRHHEASGKRLLVWKCSNNDFCTFIWCILLSVTCGKKRYRIWAITTRKDLGEAVGQIDIDVHGNIYLLKVRCPLYHLRYSFLCHWTILSYTISLICWVFLLVLTSLSFICLRCFLEKVQWFQVLLGIFIYLYIRKSYQYLLESVGGHWRI